LKARINDLGATLVITADGGFRRGKEVKLKTAVDEALTECPGVRDVIVYKRTGSDTPMKEGRDLWWHALDANATEDCPAVPLDSEHPLYVLYTSGTTGKPKGILHTTGGYLTYVTATMKWVFDLKEEDTYWCSADIGWVTGHSYIVYGPLSAGATSVMYEGAPDFPQFDRWWRLVEKYRISILYTSPTAIRALIRQGDHWPNSHDLSSLRLLGSVGEPINPAAWEWYHRVIGKGRCPIVDTWWQTETGGILIAPMPGAVPAKPGSGTLPMPGIIPAIVDLNGKELGEDKEGFLILRRPWPAMIRTIWGDPDRYKEQYWSRVPGAYFTGDAARRDADGYYWVLGRVDDVMNVSGHRLSTMEVESALVRHPAVAEAAVVGKPHEITGQAVCCFVTLKKGDYSHEQLGKELRQWVAHEIGAFARPEEIRFTDALPKTRSGKIMRRLLREIVTNNTVAGDVTTLEDMNVITKLAAQQDED
jgi:acetyl-CoA synthetase